MRYYHTSSYVLMKCQKQDTETQNVLSVKFGNAHIGLYEVPILFSFRNNRTSENIVIIRELAVYVEESLSVHEKEVSPYTKKKVTASVLMKTTKQRHNDDQFRIPPEFKAIFAIGLEVNAEASDEIKARVKSVRDVFDIGVTKDNYKKYFRYLLWFEEAIVKKNYEDYNMADVKIQLSETETDCYYLTVPGQKLKRPSLLEGDLLFVKPSSADIMFEAVVTMIKANNVIEIRGLHKDFNKHYNEHALFDIRFFLSRLPLERMHQAIDNIQNGHESRIFPAQNTKRPAVKKITEFFNPLIKHNVEQRTAVEHIISETSGTAPYLVHGPPGTGKTVTIIEAILQLVLMNPAHRILVCTDCNSTADYIANLLINYVKCFQNGENFLLRASSKYRSWENLPETLIPYSNGSSHRDFKRVSITKFMSYNIVVTTLSHAAKFAKHLKRKPRYITHLFIDEAAQASEPVCLIPVGGLLRTDGSLILAGDPLQLGPVIISHQAKEVGLGLSLMERLKKYYSLYSDEQMNPNYMVMLRDNFRSHPDILQISNDLFYNGQLRSKAAMDNLTFVDILEEHKKSRAIVFHSVISKEQRMGKSPSFFNNMEFAMVQKYIISLITRHNVPQEEIGVISPYTRQVHKINDWLEEKGYYNIEVGTVEAFQGKEKRVVIITTVRAKSDLTKTDGKFKLGFLSDPKRFNVAITRAKAKTIVIGNPIILENHRMWNAYIKTCQNMGTFLGSNVEPLDEHTKRSIVDQITPLLKELVVK
ncbi:putative helicase mov-10-B.1 [Aphomia sociella]